MPHLLGGAASFTDDTSLPNVPFVSIHAQVLAETCELGWFDLMRSMSGAAPGIEFKKAGYRSLFLSGNQRAMLAAKQHRQSSPHPYR